MVKSIRTAFLRKKRKKHRSIFLATGCGRNSLLQNRVMHWMTNSQTLRSQFIQGSQCRSMDRQAGMQLPYANKYSKEWFSMCGMVLNVAKTIPNYCRVRQRFRYHLHTMQPERSVDVPDNIWVHSSILSRLLRSGSIFQEPFPENPNPRYSYYLDNDLPTRHGTDLPVFLDLRRVQRRVPL